MGALGPHCPHNLVDSKLQKGELHHTYTLTLRV